MIEKIKKYVELYNEFEEKSKIDFQEDELNLIEQVKTLAITNEPLKELLSQIEISSPIERKNLVNNYINSLENNNEIKEEVKIEEPPKQKVKSTKTGYIDVLLLSIITGFIGGVLTTLTMLLIK